MTNKQFAEKLLAALDLMKDNTPRHLWENMQHMASAFADGTFCNAAAPRTYNEMRETLLCGARDWLHHVQGCSHFSLYPNCSAINLHYFGEDSDTWGKTPSGRDCDRYEARALDVASGSLCRLADCLGLFSSH